MTKEDWKEWVEHPRTAWLLEGLEADVENLKRDLSEGSGYSASSPQDTFTFMTSNLARIDVAEDIIDFINMTWEENEERE
jgi:hypothetical protein